MHRIVLLAVILTVAFMVPVWSADVPEPDPTAAGFSAERLDRIDAVMKRYVESGTFPGMTVVVARNGQVGYSRSFGYSDVEAQKPVQRDTVFRIYSMSKPVTVVAVMMLYEEGRFMLDEPVSKYIPSLKEVKVYQPPGSSETPPADREMTIRDLLRHTAGLGYGWGDDPVSDVYRKLNVLDRSVTLAEAVDRLALAPLYFAPGSEWRYSVSIDVLGRLVEIWSGQTLDVFFQERLFGPLGMSDTGFFVQPGQEERLTALYQFNSEGRLVRVPDTAAIAPYDPNRSKLLSGGGGLLSTTADYLRFAQMLLNGGELNNVRILGERTIRLMSADHLPAGIVLPWDKLQGHGYGFGVSVLTDIPTSLGMGSVGDWGWDGAASTYFRVDPEERLLILLMTHRMPCDTEIQVKLKTLVYQALGSLESSK